MWNALQRTFALVILLAAGSLSGCQSRGGSQSYGAPDLSCSNGCCPDSNGCCVQKTVEGHLEPAAVMFVLDRSASMRGVKWSVATRAIVDSLKDPQKPGTDLGAIPPRLLSPTDPLEAS